MRHLRHTFGDLPLGATFWLDATRTSVRGVRYRQEQGPYVKVAERRYREVGDEEGRRLYETRRDARVRATPPEANLARGESTKPVDFGEGIRVVYLPVNQAWVVMWMDQIVRGPIPRHEAMAEAKHITSRSGEAENMAGASKGRARIESVEVHVVEDQDPDTSYLDQGEEWAERREAYRRGAFSFVGVQAVANIIIPTGAGMGITQKIASPGLWGIETDSRRSYFREIAKEEITQLKSALETLGVNTRSFAAMARDAVASVDVGEPDPPVTRGKKKKKKKKR